LLIFRKVGEACKTAEEADNQYSIIYDEQTGPAGTIPTYANSSQAFWQGLDSCQEEYKLEDIVREIHFWNATTASWEVIYESIRPGAGSFFHLLVFPYEGNSILVCHTLNDGLAKYGALLRIQPRIGTKQYIYHSMFYKKKTWRNL